MSRHAAIPANRSKAARPADPVPASASASASGSGSVRSDSGRRSTPGLSRRQAGALLCALLLLVGAVVAASSLVKPSKARAFDLFHGSIFLGDDRAPVAVDLTNGKPTVRLLNAYAQVSAESETGIDVVPLNSGTLLVNKATGEFNVVDTAGFVVKTTDGGVALPKVAGQSGTQAVPAGDSAYVIQSGAQNTAVYLVGQTTVEAARTASAQVRPRASVKIAESTAGAAGSAVSANGDLWILSGSATGDRTLRQLSLPANSTDGVELTTVIRGSAPQLGALAVSSSEATGSTTGTSNPGSLGSGDSIALATATTLTRYTQDAQDGTGYHASRFTISGLPGTDRILPATGGVGAQRFLFHGPQGWSLVTTPSSGQSAELTRLTGVAGDADLVAPAISNGTLYTLDRTNGTLLAVDLGSGRSSGVAGMAKYPVVADATGKALESADFVDTYIFARGSRIVVNSPNHRLAVILFTDGKAKPLSIDKSTAVDLNAAGGAAAVADTRTAEQRRQHPAPAPGQPTPAIAAPAQQVNNTAQCTTTTQIPHIPKITTVTPAARSVNLLWSYPLLDSQDCIPSTYTVAVTLVGGSAPKPPGALTVQGQSGANFTGLYPNSRYQVVVTAFINGRGTSSTPTTFTTGREGPAAPTAVQTSADSSGDWTVTWNACNSTLSGCVQAANWSITPTFCDGAGLSSPLSPLVITADPTLSKVTATYPGTASTLGRGVSFAVQGIGPQGDAGATTADSSCVYSWSPLVASAYSLRASQPPTTGFGETSTSTFTLSITGDPVVVGGGAGVQYNYKLLSDGNTVNSQGPTSKTSVVFSGLIAGKEYQAEVLVVPPPHSPASGVVVGPIAMTPAASAWPALTATSTFQSDDDATTGTLSVAIGGLGDGAAGSERYHLGSGTLTCGNTSMNLPQDGSFDPSTPLVFNNINRLLYRGSCTVAGLTLTEAGTGSYFGGTTSPSFADDGVDLGQPPYAGGPNDFTASFDATATNVLVKYVGHDPAASLYQGFVVSVSRNGTPCGTASYPSSTPSGTYTVALTDTDDCRDSPGDAGTWSASVKYTFLTAAKSASAPVTGSPPSFIPVTPTPEPTPEPTP
ncbi:hypothetical protein SAMN05892883_1328 [Jatrophihabitans sp. GAS493]|uniref:hypothetical protein n=1 Tax=Jatrophihabitans sp. GAS493 TaxID=1907575 RepID=UPI000BB72687|nr:hypothetical protein [Jatrophihabitans sp. GAS493]SOD71867.1 hypothetical protein SAMN05892883_1328 [Jatrophihabitans sp. GAS493]